MTRRTVTAPTPVPPWLVPFTERLHDAHAAGRFPHALLVHESPGAGGEWLARWALALMLCTSPDSRPCGVCVACARVQSGQHPDCLFVRPEESREIRIEQIRTLIGELALTSHGGGCKGALIAPADAMNAKAANALLKILEEPPPRTLLLLVTAQPARLPATILSRCLRLRVTAPTNEVCTRWLATEGKAGDWAAAIELLGPGPFLLREHDPAEFAGVRDDVEHALAAVLAGTLDPGQAAERWGRSEPYELRLRCIENWVTDRIRRALIGGPSSRRTRSAAYLSESVSDLNIRHLFRLADEVRELRTLVDTPINRGLALERLFWRMVAAHRAAG